MAKKVEEKGSEEGNEERSKPPQKPRSNRASFAPAPGVHSYGVGANHLFARHALL